MFDAHKVWDFIVNILVASAGGMARVLSIKDRKRMKTGRVLSEIFISAFAGAMFLFLANEMGLSGNMTGLVCGVAGWLGPRALDAVVAKFEKTTGAEVKKEDKKEA